MNRFRDWLEQARLNLEHARHSTEAGHHAWACFAAQQAAEAALKGLHLRLGQVAWGHSTLDLFDHLPEDLQPPQELVDAARVLDKYYIPTRYPDAHPAGPAARHYTGEDARAAITYAESILRYCERTSLED